MCRGRIYCKGRLGSCYTILKMLMNLFIIEKGALSLYALCSWGNKIFIFNSPRPMDGCPLLKHYIWRKRKTLSRASGSISDFSVDDVLTSTKNSSQKRKLITSNISEQSTMSKKRKVAQGCHVCGESFSRNSLKKRCSCKKLCHKNCVGHCDK